MRIGIIDLGTNSVRFDIHEWVKDGLLRCLYRKKVMVRLGQDVFKRSQLQPEAMKRTIEAIEDFCEVAERLRVVEIVGGATSAVRDAKNGRAFVQKLKAQCGVQLRIISGKEEARLIMKGIRSFEPLAVGLFGFIDIGGGSTEVGVSDERATFYLESFAVGAARVSQMLSRQPPLASDLFEIRKWLRRQLGSRTGFKDWPKLEYLLGASGTIKALAKIMRANGHGRKIDRKDLEALVAMMSRMTPAELKKVPGMEDRRLDLILPGAMVLEECMDFFGAKKVYRTKYALREGFLQEKLEEYGLASEKYELEEVAGLTK